MFIFCIILAVTFGVLLGMGLAEFTAARRQVTRLQALEERAFKRGEVAAWQEATRRLLAAR